MDKIIVKLFFGCGIPFKVIKSNYFKQMISIVRHYDLGYLPPSYEKLRTTLLKGVKNDLIKNLNVVKESWKEIGCTITCDSWTSVDNIPLLNILCVCSKGDFFCKELVQLARQKWQFISLTHF
jgi:hypothetical protein